jgi:hypothetical protein
MKQQNGFADYTRAHFASWLTIMSGPTSVVLAVLGMAVSEPTARYAFVLAGMGTFAWTAYAVWFEQREKTLAAERKVQELLAEYAGCLSFVNLSVIDHTVIDRPSGRTLGRTVEVVVYLKNSLSRAVSYKIISTVLDGTSLPVGPDRHLISGNTDAQFTCAAITIPFGAKPDLVQCAFSFEPEYGPTELPPTRRMRKSVNARFFVKDNVTHFRYEPGGDIDEPILPANLSA